MFKNITFVSVLVITSFCDFVFSYNKARLLNLHFSVDSKFKESMHYHEESLLHFTERSAKHGYPSENHTVVTEDGYILTIFRIKVKSNCSQSKDLPVLLHHGLFVNAISWIDAGPNTSLPYLLSDKCFDVWCANARGTEYSRSHTKLNPDKDPEYWQFSFHEMGMHDLPAMIDYILDKTNNQKLNYIAHSQSSTAFFILTSSKPLYMEKFGVSISLAPAVWLKNTKSPLLRFLAMNHRLVYSLIDGVGAQEFLHVHSIIQESSHYICHSKGNARGICASALTIVDGQHKGSIASDTIRIMFGHLPDGVAIKNLAHLGQVLVENKFQQFDYGQDNLKMYGTDTPSLYDISNITTPVILMYGENDQFVNSTDVNTLYLYLTGPRELYKVRKPHWNHLDFVWSKYIPKYLAPKIIESLKKFTLT